MIEIKKEKSCGAVVFTTINGKIRYLIIQSLEGIFGFPKGHVENDETEIETALREVYEETSVKIDIVDGFRTTSHYTIRKNEDISKEVVYFIGKFEGQTPHHQASELLSAKLYSYEEAFKLITYKDTKSILKEANTYIKMRKLYK